MAKSKNKFEIIANILEGIMYVGIVLYLSLLACMNMNQIANDLIGIVSLIFLVWVVVFTAKDMNLGGGKNEKR